MPSAIRRGVRSTCSSRSVRATVPIRISASRRRWSPPRWGCTPMSHGTTSTSWRPAGTSRSSRPGSPAPARAVPRSGTSPSVTRAPGILPVRSDDLVLSLLGRALDRLPHDEAEMIAEEVGAEYGRAMAEGLTGDALTSGRRSLRSAMQSVADALDRPRFRCAHRGSKRPVAHHQRPLPVRRRGDRPSGDLRRRSRHGQGHARRADRRPTATPASTS